jgi:hypothetical protein
MSEKPLRTQETITVANFDQRHQKVNTQYNAAHDIHIHGQPQADAAVLFDQGVGLLRAKSFNQAVNILKDAVKAEPSMRMAYYYLAIALLKGKRPKILSRNEINEIDEWLCAAIALDEADGLFHWFRALVREDYFNGNGMISRAPSVQEIISIAMSRHIDIGELRILLHDMPMNNNWLYTELAKQIF